MGKRSWMIPGTDSTAGRDRQDRVLLGACLITVAAAFLLSLTFIIDFKDRICELIDNRTTVRLIDVVFRMTAGALLVLVVAPLIGYRRETGWFRRYLAHMRVSMGPDAKATAAATALGVGSLIGLLGALTAVAGVFGWDPGVLVRNEQWVVLFLALVPGVWEELAFRGIILANLETRYSTRAAILISSVLFGLFHLGNFFGSDDVAAVLFGVVAATIFGIGWAYIVVSTDSIIPAMVLHYLVDVLLDAELFLDPAASDDSVAPVYLGLVLLWPTLTIIGTRVVCISRLAQLRPL
jgi:membrane protease YdiL (CAAX protease family)